MRAALVLLLAAACTDPPPPPSGPEVTSKVVTFEIPFGGRSKLDLLFVIDSSTAMAPYREHIVAEMPRFANILADYPSGMPDVNIAVTTADFAAGGALRTSSLVDGTFIMDGMRDGVRVKNYTGELGSVLAELADVGASQSASPRPFDVLPLALAAPDFVREYSYLGIVLVTGTDDASAVAVQDIAAELKTLKTDPANVMLFGIHPSPAPRLEAFLSQFPNRASSTPIDAADPSAGFVSIGQLYRSHGLAVCVDPLLDVDPMTPGDQYECSIEMFDNATQTSALWPRCGSGATPCWDLTPDPSLCFDGGLALDVDFGPDKLPYEGGSLRGQCLTAVID